MLSRSLARTIICIGPLGLLLVNTGCCTEMEISAARQTPFLSETVAILPSSRTRQEFSLTPKLFGFREGFWKHLALV